MAKEWERHNSPTGTHIWCGQEHIADITGKGQNEVAQIAVTAHNTCQELNPENPLAVAEGMKGVVEELREADGVICELCKRVNPQHKTPENCTCADREARLQALTKIEGGK